MFKKYHDRIEAELEKTLLGFGQKTALRDACEYALKSGGKRLRPLFVLMIADALGNGLDAIQAALSVEFFHTSSLIADDLPCMDNDDERRNRASLHRVYPESVALLASYTLIAAGYEGIYKNGKVMKRDPHFCSRSDEATMLSLEIATRCAGIFGATGGQYLDLFPPDRSLETIRLIIEKKTVTLFQISFAFGWLFGGGDPKLLKEVETVAYHLGMAYQIGDDLQDQAQDDIHSCEINIAAALGVAKSYELFASEMDAFVDGLTRLGLWNQAFKKAADYLYDLVPAAMRTC
jgi:geranylgeranyl diphosphate synthase type II